MGAALQRIWNETASHVSQWAMWSARSVNPTPKVKAPEQPGHRIGKFRADYSPVTTEELCESDAKTEALLRRSKVVSATPGCDTPAPTWGGPFTT